MNDFRFANPDWVHAIWLVLAIAGLLVFLELRGRSVLDNFLSRIMQSRLVHRASIARRLTTIGLVTLAMLLLVGTLMQPQWGMTVQNMQRASSQIMICLDVSKSMLAEDVAPNRLERAKVELDSLLGLMDEGQQVGLIAFAGKATVMCPMTTDFGFLRLILGELQPESVGLGGTKIGEALRKAVEGFGAAGDINRMVLLITDGEDHDSFPLEVATSAREKGVKIVSIGIGDEAGSKIEITDPKTGARSRVKDRNGNDVISRLDGEMLRDIALETEGAYIPAGTGALDLESIYQAHIATMLRGSIEGRQRIIRNEAFQWPLLAAIVTLILSMIVATPIRLRENAAEAARQFSIPASGKTAACFLAISAACTLLSAPNADAQTDPKSTAADSSGELASEITARDAYNRSLALINSDPDQAEQFLNRARRDAGVDGELRFRALYNLGWVEVNRADQLLEQEPKQALAHLQQAANRFRESIRVRPNSNEARHNLEIISRRILELTDALNKSDPRDLATRLDELIQQIRDHQSEIRGVVQQSDRSVSNRPTHELRQPFRRLGVTQRQLISDVQKFADDARGENDAIKAKEPDELSDQENLRSLQITNMLSYLDRALQRMNQSRSLTRRMQGVRGFGRWSSALSDAKRARDQLRNPVEIISQIIGDASELNDLTRTFQQGRTELELEAIENQSDVPPWLTEELLTESQLAVNERNSELLQVLTQAVAAQSTESTAQSNTGAAKPTDDPKTQQLLDNIRQSLPLIQSANNSFGLAHENLKQAQFGTAVENQNDAIVSLADAWELFFDIRRLIEAIYRNELIIGQLVAGAKQQPKMMGPMAEAVLQPQQKNLERCRRLDSMLDRELLQLAGDPSKGANPQNQASGSEPPREEQIKAESDRLKFAKKLVEQIVGEMNSADLEFEKLVKKFIATPDVEADVGEDTQDVERSVEVDLELVKAERHVANANEKIEELRRLFFSLIEHLRDTTNRQSNLNDSTLKESVETRPEENGRVGSLANKQQQLGEISRRIADALQKQSEQAAAVADQPAQDDPSAPQVSRQDAAKESEKLFNASQFVDTAEKSMNQAASEMQKIAATNEVPADETTKSDAETPFKITIDNQKQALENLLQALALLDENQNEQNQDQQQQNQDQQQSESQQNEQQQRDQQQQMNAQQLLQLIRDREAQRRKSKQRRRADSRPVEKDW